MFENVAARSTTGLERVDKKTGTVFCTLLRACVCLICVISRRYFGDINGDCLSSSTPFDVPSLPFLCSYFMVTAILKSVIRSSNRPANENSYCEDDSFIRDKLNSSR